MRGRVPAVLTPGTPPANAVLLVFDIDQSLLKWEEYNLRVVMRELRQVADWLGREHRAGRLRVMLNTGRSLHAVQHINQFLDLVPVDLLVTGDGQQIFWNRRQQQTGPWLRDLRVRDQDPIWRRSHAGAWRERLALRALWGSYRSWGFRSVARRRFAWSHDVDRLLHYAGSEPVGELYAVGTGEGPAVKVRFDPCHQDSVRRLTEQVVHTALATVARHGLRALPDVRAWTPFWSAESDRAYSVAGIKHPTVNKGSPINWVIAELEAHGTRFSGVIPVGDSGNDEGMIIPRWYQGRDARAIPNLPIYHDGGHPADRVLQDIQHREEMVVISPTPVAGRRAQWAPDLTLAMHHRMRQLIPPSLASVTRPVGISA
jgi:hydroxymethylpyrimidine pyrophosphatase-like HAD family hydrolase